MTEARRWVTITGVKKSKGGQIYVTGTYNGKKYRRNVGKNNARHIKRVCETFEGENAMPLDPLWVEA